MADIKQCIQPLQTVWELANIEWGKRYSDIYPLCISTYRSFEEQNKLYAQGRTVPGQVVTKARGGQSPHNYIPSFAFDYTFKSKSTGKVYWTNILYYKEFRDICISINPNVDWLGKQGDYGHIELKNWKGLIK